MGEAKTIDLCNNPMTKISKLEIAKTRVQEWFPLDQEATAIEGKNLWENDL
jgi:UDP-glucose:glycoprotein glucosyltransferase